ncbi:MAG: hypothetical protein HOI61_06730 [Gammaproteobacteria bacterium]|jgi:hypothetical protein|nr:hypothetical protein [Gammaproteobacteria bacterium]MBT7831683.1 hypothetical protein [Candidatus Neomarinimicrobiota bacterium]MBT4080494.1 hypothetical protein [Gammaproteobacteria bacterium]MBT4302025.1 hypothetical protein [Gammaproteobacteria bacterium]MBT5370410.1 hypothetical protein [Gammaproteobacteria bacterium]
MKSYLSLLAAVVSKKMNVPVVVKSGINTFATDGKAIYVPDAWSGNEGSEVLLRGGLCHEGAGHIRHTQFDGEPQKWKRAAKPFPSGLENVIEDVRIEKAASLVFPGGKKMLSEMISMLDSEDGFFPHDENAGLAGVVMSLIARTLRSEILGQPLGFDKITVQANDLLGTKLAAEILEIARKGATSSSTTEVQSSTDEIIALLSDLADQQDEQDEQDEQDQQESEDDSDGDKQGASDLNNQIRAALDSEDDEVESGDVIDSVKKALQSVSEVDNFGSIEREKADWTGAKFSPSPEASKLSVRLQAKLSELLASRMDAADDRVTEIGRLSGSALASTAVGNRFVFTEELDEGEGIDTSIHFLVDSSGSMGTKCSEDSTVADHTVNALYALGQALGQYEQQGVSFAISLFNYKVHDVKLFDEPWNKAKSNLEAYDPSYGTFFVPAYQRISTDIIKRHEKRKIFYVITDGALGDSSEVHNITDVLNRNGVEVRALFIGNVEISNIDRDWKYHYGFQSSAAVSVDGSNIQKAIYSTLKAVL